MPTKLQPQVTRLDVDRYLRGRKYTPADASVDVRETKAELTYSRRTFGVHFMVDGKFIISPAFNGRFQLNPNTRTVLANQFDAAHMDDAIGQVLATAHLKCLDAYHDPKHDTPGHAVVYPKGPQDKSLTWVITQQMEKRGDLIARAVMPAVPTDADKPTLMLSVGYDSNGFERLLDYQWTVQLAGGVRGVLHRVEERCKQAEAVKLTRCTRCFGPAYVGGRCIIPECTDGTIALDAMRGGPCARCGGPTYTASKRCISKNCRNAA
jgi:hypothetical protein